MESVCQIERGRVVTRGLCCHLEAKAAGLACHRLDSSDQGGGDTSSAVLRAYDQGGDAALRLWPLQQMYHLISGEADRLAGYLAYEHARVFVAEHPPEPGAGVFRAGGISELAQQRRDLGRVA